MPSLSLSVFCFMPSPWMLLLRPASGRPVPTPSRPHHSLPLGLRPLRSLGTGTGKSRCISSKSVHIGLKFCRNLCFSRKASCFRPWASCFSRKASCFIRSATSSASSLRRLAFSSAARTSLFPTTLALMTPKMSSFLLRTRGSSLSFLARFAVGSPDAPIVLVGSA